jgi:hypothetical protein
VTNRLHRQIEGTHIYDVQCILQTNIHTSPWDGENTGAFDPIMWLVSPSIRLSGPEWLVSRRAIEAHRSNLEDGRLNTELCSLALTRNAYSPSPEDLHLDYCRPKSPLRSRVDQK